MYSSLNRVAGEGQLSYSRVTVMIHESLYRDNLIKIAEISNGVMYKHKFKMKPMDLVIDDAGKSRYLII